MPPAIARCGGAGYQGARRMSTDTVTDYGIMDTRYAIYFAIVTWRSSPWSS